MKHGTTPIAFIEDPNGYKIELIERKGAAGADRPERSTFAMKAAVFNGQNRWRSRSCPSRTAGPGEVVLKVHDCGICGSDLHAVQYGFGMPPES